MLISYNRLEILLSNWHQWLTDKLLFYRLNHIVLRKSQYFFLLALQVGLVAAEGALLFYKGFIVTVNN